MPEQRTTFQNSLLSPRLSYGLGSVPLHPVDPEKQVSIVQSWSGGPVTWLKLSHPEFGSKANYRVVWLLTFQARTYVVIELAPGWKEDEEEPEQTLVRVLDGKTIETITKEEFDRLLPFLKTNLESGRQFTRADAEALFGALPAYGSPEHRAHDLLAAGLTNKMAIGTKLVAAGEPLTIKKRWRELDSAFFVVSDSEGKEELEFSLRWLFLFEQTYYAVLFYPVEFTAEEDIPPQVLVKIRDYTTITPASDEELKRAAPSCIAVMEESRGTDLDELSAIFGPLPEWEEAGG